MKWKMVLLMLHLQDLFYLRLLGVDLQVGRCMYYLAFGKLGIKRVIKFSLDSTSPPKKQVRTQTFCKSYTSGLNTATTHGSKNRIIAGVTVGHMLLTIFKDLSNSTAYYYFVK